MQRFELQVFKPYEKGDSKGKYRLAVIDPNKISGYPANFVCLLPRKIYDVSKPLSLFAKKFGGNSVNYAVELLEEAIRREKDVQAKAELQKRLKTLKAL
jgi:hypothetical protein